MGFSEAHPSLVTLKVSTPLKFIWQGPHPEASCALLGWATRARTTLPVLFPPPGCPFPPLLSRLDLRFSSGLRILPWLLGFIPDVCSSSANVVAMTAASGAPGCLGHPAVLFLEGPCAILYSLLHPAPHPHLCQAQNQTPLSVETCQGQGPMTGTPRDTLSLRLQTPKTHLPPCPAQPYH